MEETTGAQYAIRIAVQTLKERCYKLQQRVSILEEENLKLRLETNNCESPNDSLDESDKLKQQTIELTEQKQQLQHKVRMVVNENQELWNRLSKLSKVNQNLGTQLNKINDSLIQHSIKTQKPGNDVHSPLIRSKTFTQDEPHTRLLQKNLDDNNKISLELEDVSLKLADSISKEKDEFDSIYSKLGEIQLTDNILTESFGFYYDDEFGLDILQEFQQTLDELAESRLEIVRQRDGLQTAVDFIKQLQGKMHCCSRCGKRNQIQKVDKSTITTINETDKLKTPKNDTFVETNLKPMLSVEVISDRICPMCCKAFKNGVPFHEFQLHVEKHFQSTVNEPDFDVLQF